MPRERTGPGGAATPRGPNSIARSLDHTRNQQRRLLAALRQGPLTTLDCRERLGIMHPGGRVLELRERGWPIVTVWGRQIDAAGQLHRVARYVLATGRQPEVA